MKSALKGRRTSINVSVVYTHSPSFHSETFHCDLETTGNLCSNIRALERDCSVLNVHAIDFSHNNERFHKALPLA